MKRARLLSAAMLVVATPALADAPEPDAAQPQPATSSTTRPPWTRRPGEGWLAVRHPLANLHVSFGAQLGISERTTLRQVGAIGCDGSPVSGCDPFTPTADLGSGGGGSLTLGARLSPLFRVALTAAIDGAYRFEGHNTVSSGVFAGSKLSVRVPVRSLQAVASAQLDLGGLLRRGRWNPYLTGGVGVASNRTGEFSQAFVPATGGPEEYEALPGSEASSTGLLWTAGGGVQYQLAASVILDVYYQRLDAGTFRSVVSEADHNELEGSLRTHRLGVAISLELSQLARRIAGR